MWNLSGSVIGQIVAILCLHAQSSRAQDSTDIHVPRSDGATDQRGATDKRTVGNSHNTIAENVPLHTDCAEVFTQHKCDEINYQDDYHPDRFNGGIVDCSTAYCSSAEADDREEYCADEWADFPPTRKTCTRYHQCTTCLHKRCLWCLESEIEETYTEPMGVKFLFIVVSLVCGALISTIFGIWKTRWKPPFTVLMFIFGLFLGFVGEYGIFGCAISDSINAWKNQDAHSILYSLLPPLLFESAFNVNYHVFIKVLKSSLMLATSGVVLSTGLLGCVFMLIFPHEFSMIEKCNPGCAGYAPDPTCSSHHGDTGGPVNIDCSADGWIAAFMFGAIVSATDPVAVVAALQSLGASPKLSHLIEGESLLNDGSAVVVFVVCKGLVTHQIDHLDGEPTGAGQTVVSIFLMLIRLALGGVALGYIFSYIVYSWLRVSRRLNASIEISIMVVSVYLVFYLSEHWFGASGVLATVVFGLNLAKRRHLAMTVDTEEKNEIVWEEIGYVANSFVFALAGVILWRIVMEDNVFAHTEVHATGTDSAHGGTEAGHSRRLDGGGHDSNETAHGLTTALSDEYSFGGHLLFSVFLYFIMLAVRLSTILLHYRCMRKVTRPGYQVEIKEAFFMAFAGLRGAVSLCVAMQVDHMPIDHRVKDIILFHTCMCVFFTVLVNGSSAPWVYAKLGLGVMDTTHADLDTGAVQLLDEKLNEWCKTALKEEWAFREPDIANEDRSGVLNSEEHAPNCSLAANLWAIKKMLEIQLPQEEQSGNPGVKVDLSPLTNTGILRVKSPGINHVWEQDVVKTPRHEWRAATIEQNKQPRVDAPDPSKYQVSTWTDNEKAFIRGHFKTDVHKDQAKVKLKGAMGGGKVGLHDIMIMMKGNMLLELKQKKFQLSLQPKKRHMRRSLYSIYLTAIGSYYHEELEASKMSAAACDYLNRAIHEAKDKMAEYQQRRHERHVDGGHPDDTKEKAKEDVKLADIIWYAHEQLVTQILSFKLLHEIWYKPPVHKLQLAVEILITEYEAHKNVGSYLHKNISAGASDGTATANKFSSIIGQFEAECDRVCAGALKMLAVLSARTTNRVLLPVVNTYHLYRKGHHRLLHELRELKVHGMMSAKCYEALHGLVMDRYQDIRTEFINDGPMGQYVRIREYIFRWCRDSDEYQAQVSERSQRSAVDKLASNTRMEEHVSSSTKLMMRSESHMETHMESEAAPTAGAEVERAAEYAAAVAAVAEPELKPKLEPKPETEPAAVTKDP